MKIDHLLSYVSVYYEWQVITVSTSFPDFQNEAKL